MDLALKILQTLTELEKSESSVKSLAIRNCVFLLNNSKSRTRVILEKYCKLTLLTQIEISKKFDSISFDIDFMKLAAKQRQFDS